MEPAMIGLLFGALGAGVGLSGMIMNKDDKDNRGWLLLHSIMFTLNVVMVAVNLISLAH